MPQFQSAGANMRLLLKLIPLFVVLGVTGCLVEPEWVSYTTTVTAKFDGANGFVINGGTLTNVVVNSDSAVGTSMEIFGTYLMTTVTLFGHVNDVATSCELTLITGIDPVPATFIWSAASGTDHVGVEVDFHEQSVNHFTTVSGMTTITRFGGPGEPIEGTFSGTMRSRNNSSLSVEVNGKFSAIMRR